MALTGTALRQMVDGSSTEKGFVSIAFISMVDSGTGALCNTVNARWECGTAVGVSLDECPSVIPVGSGSVSGAFDGCGDSSTSSAVIDDGAITGCSDDGSIDGVFDCSIDGPVAGALGVATDDCDHTLVV